MLTGPPPKFNGTRDILSSKNRNPMTLKDSFSADATARAARCMASGSVRKSSAGSSRGASPAERHGGQTYSRHSGSSAPTNSGLVAIHFGAWMC